MIPHLRHRDLQLERCGWRGPEAEWIALVCLHSGRFCTFFQCRRNRALRFVERLLDRRQAVEEPLDGLPTTRPCRIVSRGLYLALGLEHVRHRRSASPRLRLRRLLSLDYVLEHPQWNWLPTEGEKVAALEALGIPCRLFPCRYDSGSDPDRRRDFVLKLPLAIEDDLATFVYADPGQRTDTGLRAWGQEHAPLWRALQRAGQRSASWSWCATRAAADGPSVAHVCGAPGGQVHPAGGARGRGRDAGALGRIARRDAAPSSSPSPRRNRTISAASSRPSRPTTRNTSPRTAASQRPWTAARCCSTGPKHQRP